MSALMTLPEFAEAAARAVEASGAAPENRQAKAMPAARMIRYYTARGLLPPPGSRGRALVYGRRHLVQLVAIKRLQGDGLSLDEIGGRLTGMSDSDLEALAAVPDEAIPENLGDVPDAPSSERSRRAGRFWDLASVATSSGGPRAGGTSRVAPGAWPARAAIAAPVSAPPRTPTALTELRLSDSVRLLIEGDAAGLPVDELRAAATPLLQLLASVKGKEL
jgi:DNA-binding transcriptional MerR regulator